MSWVEDTTAPTRREAHFGDRVVRCFVDRDRDAFALFERAVAQHPDKEAVVAGELRLSYRALGDIVERVAAGLNELGLAAGDRIAVLMGNRAEFVVAVLAALRLGAIAVPIGTRLAGSEVSYVLEHCGARALIFDVELAPTIAAAGSSIVSCAHVRCGSASDTVSFEGLRLDAPRLGPRQPPREEDTAFILYTSGTTGLPKGAMLTHFNVCHSVRHFALAQRLTAHERSLLAVPASHVTGLIAIVFSMLNVGGAILMLWSFAARAFLELAARERMTHAVLVPAMYNLCLLDPGLASYDLSAWRIGSYGGAPMPETTIEAIGELFPQLALMNGYGATETTSPTSITPIGQGLARRDTIGLPLHCADVIIVDERGCEVPAGESGEIWIRGPMVVPGYWLDPQATAASFTGGFWHSGDVGSIDRDGYLRLIDRKKDMINRGGYKIYSVEVENVIARHPAVLECAVVAKPCPVLGERVHAYISRAHSDLTEHDIKSLCAEHLADYKVPETLTFLDGPLPRNGAGKLLKRRLREDLAERSHS
jgi:long-chain acyl-CoA synthetase